MTTQSKKTRSEGVSEQTNFKVGPLSLKILDFTNTLICLVRIMNCCFGDEDMIRAFESG